MGIWRKINVTSSLVSVIETKPNFHISHGYTTSINHFWAIHIVRYVSKWTFGRYEIQTLVAKIVVKITYIWRQYHQREASTIFHVRSAPPPFTPIFNVGLIFWMLKVIGHHHISTLKAGDRGCVWYCVEVPDCGVNKLSARFLNCDKVLTTPFVEECLKNGSNNLISMSSKNPFLH